MQRFDHSFSLGEFQNKMGDDDEMNGSTRNRATNCSPTPAPPKATD